MELTQETYSSIQSPRNSDAKTPRSFNIKRLAIPSKIPEASHEKRSSILSYRMSTDTTNLDFDPSDLNPPLSDRPNTIKIFKQKLQNEKQVNINILSQIKRNFDRPIQAGDTLNTVKAVVDKRKKEYEQRKKGDLRGSMYMNDLWGRDYEKDIIKSAKVKKDLERKFFFQKNQDKHLPIFNELHNVRPSQLKIELDPSMIRSGSNTTPEERTPLSPHTPRYFLGLARKAFDSPVTEDNDYGIKPSFTEENSPAILANPHRKLSQFNLIKNKIEQKTHPKNTSLSGHYLPRFERFIKESPKNSRKGLEQTNGSWTMRNSYYAGSQSSTRVSTVTFNIRDYSEKSKLSVKRIQKAQGKKLITSKEGVISRSELSNIQTQRFIRRGTKSIASKDFLGEKNQQVNMLLGKCEEQLQEKKIWNGLINNLEGLFVNQKYDKKKKFTVKEKDKVVENCKYLFSKRSTNKDKT